MTRRELWEMIVRGEAVGGGGAIGERCKQHYTYVFFCLLQFVSGFLCTGNIIRKKRPSAEQASNETVVKNPGDSESRQISISICNNYRNQSHLVVHTSPAYFALYRHS